MITISALQYCYLPLLYRLKQSALMVITADGYCAGKILPAHHLTEFLKHDAYTGIFIITGMRFPFKGDTAKINVLVKFELGKNSWKNGKK